MRIIAAQRCSLVWISRTRRSARLIPSANSSVFTGDLRAFQPPRCRLAGPLRPAAGFPGPRGGSSRPRLLRSLRPARHPQLATSLPLPRWLRERRAIPGGSHVHHATDPRCRRPTLPPRHRHDYAVGIHRGLPPRGISPGQEFPPGTTPFGTHRNPAAHIRQIGAGGWIEGLYTLVPHVRLSVLLAEPRCLAVPARPSLSGLLAALPGVPRVRLSSASPRCHDNRAARVFHPRSVTQRHVAHGAQHPPTRRPRASHLPSIA